MADITFNDAKLRSVINKITNVQRPTLHPKNENLVEVPGRDYPYDFGGNKKKTFEVKIDFVLLADLDAATPVTIDDKINSLINLLDYEEAQDLVIGGNTYKAQIYDGINVNILTGREVARGTVTFTCYVLPTV